MSQRSGKNVPKFGSFKPRTATNSAIPSLKHETSHGRKRDDRHEQSERQKGRRDDFRDRSKKRKADSSHLGRKESPDQPSSELQESDVWMMDIRGDPQNAQYESIHRYSVPSYHRAGQGSVIGLPPHIKIDRKQSTETGVVFHALRSTGNSQTIPSMPSLSFKDTETEAVDDDFLELDHEQLKEDNQKATAVEVGIWKVIEADGPMEHKRD